jgi:cytochrome c553
MRTDDNFMTRSIALPWLAAAFFTAPLRAEDIPLWAFPNCPPPPAATSGEPSEPLSLPGSKLHFTAQQIADRSVTRDWFPENHEPMPAALVQSRSPGVPACGYCHLADGSGRPENAKVAGLPVEYIIAQVNAVHAHDRHPAQAGWMPSTLMAASAESLSEQDIKSAAEYYARQKALSFVNVVEASQAPAYVNACFVLKKTAGPKSPLKESILEMPDEFERFEARDPRTAYTAYVPMGSIARGRNLAQTGGGRTQPCATCHGADLQGNRALLSPPIAGRFATYSFRQLLGFKTGARSGPAALPMQTEVAQLQQSDFIDLAAYLASLRP